MKSRRWDKRKGMMGKLADGSTRTLADGNFILAASVIRLVHALIGDCFGQGTCVAIPLWLVPASVRHS